MLPALLHSKGVEDDLKIATSFLKPRGRRGLRKNEVLLKVEPTRSGQVTVPW